MNTAGLTIKAVAERTGVSVHTLRAWERRYGVPSPHRGAENRYRLYDDQDIADVLFLKAQVEAGVSPSQASALLRQQPNRSTAVPVGESNQPILVMRSSLIDAFARSDEMVARQILDQAFGLFTPEQVALQIIEPTMSAIGERWMHNEMTVWQEHLASNVVQQKLDAVLQSQPVLPSTALLLAAACAPSEQHQLGLIIFALLARRQGWRVAYLGPSTPLDDMADLARAATPNAIVVSTTTVIGLAGLIPWLDAANRPAAPLVFGGRMPNLFPALRAHLPGDYLGDNPLTALHNLASNQRRAEFWSPPKRVRHAIDSLQQQRVGIAGEVTATFIATLPKAHRQWDATRINHATLFLIDALACALAFDVPDLDAQRHWLDDAMPPHAVTPQLIAKHSEIYANVLKKSLTKEQMRLFEPLLERMKDQG